jgi:hypothetical protein
MGERVCFPVAGGVNGPVVARLGGCWGGIPRRRWHGWRLFGCIVSIGGLRADESLAGRIRVLARPGKAGCRDR